MKEFIEDFGVFESAENWSSATLFDDYMVPLLQKELEVDPFGVCGDLIPVPGKLQRTSMLPDELFYPAHRFQPRPASVTVTNHHDKSGNIDVLVN